VLAAGPGSPKIIVTNPIDFRRHDLPRPDCATGVDTELYTDIREALSIFPNPHLWIHDLHHTKSGDRGIDGLVGLFAGVWLCT